MFVYVIVIPSALNGPWSYPKLHNWYQSSGISLPRDSQGFLAKNEEEIRNWLYFRNSLQGCFQTAIAPSLTVGSGWNFYWSFFIHQARFSPKGSSIGGLSKKIYGVENCCRNIFVSRIFQLFKVLVIFNFMNSWFTCYNSSWKLFEVDWSSLG